MRSPRFGQLRYVRAAVFAVVIMLLGTTAHFAGGGQLPTFRHGTVLFVLIFWVCVVLTRWRLPLPAVIAALGLGELALHEALMAGSAQMAGSAHGSMSDSMPSAMSGAMNSGLAHPDAMISFHLIATLLTGFALSHGENAVWLLWTWMTAHLVRAFRSRLNPLSRLRARVQPVTPSACPILSVAPLRGPPLLAFS